MLWSLVYIEKSPFESLPLLSISQHFYGWICPPSPDHLPSTLTTPKYWTWQFIWNTTPINPSWCFQPIWINIRKIGSFPQGMKIVSFIWNTPINLLCSGPDDGMMVVNNPLIRPYSLGGGGVGGVPLNSHDVSKLMAYGLLHPRKLTNVP